MSSIPANHHIGRSWTGNEIERNCPCPLEPCGLVEVGKIDPACGQHAGPKTMRQGHSGDVCPGAEEGAR